MVLNLAKLGNVGFQTLSFTAVTETNNYTYMFVAFAIRFTSKTLCTTIDHGKLKRS